MWSSVLKVVLILVIAYILYEVIEHLVLPLIWLITRRVKKSPTGESGMIGLIAEVKKWEGKKGRIFVRGELWRAESDVPLSIGQEAVVQSVKGLVLIVKPLEE
jgi:membrane-bound ClpP family serine protease